MNPSLLLIPDRYKASKLYSQIPDTGAGDLAFTRALDTATRVGSDGLIEKVRTNLVLQSQTFDDAGWTKQNSSVVSNSIAAPNGTITADSLIPINGTNVFCGVFVANATPAIKTFSFFVKKGSKRFALLLGYSGSSNCWFDLDNGVVGTRDAFFSASSITAVGNDWYRVSAVFSTAIGAINLGIYASDADNSNECTGDGTTVASFIWGAQVETGDIATPYIPTTTAAVSVGMTEDIPRIDYTGGGCGKLLLEPQRTNIIHFSEQLNNAYWTKSGATITANNAVSPAGFTDADFLVESAVNERHFVSMSNTAVSAAVHSASVFVKANGRTKFALSEEIATGLYASFDLATEVVLDQNGISASITDYGNGWYRCDYSITSTTFFMLRIVLLPNSYVSGAVTGTYLGNGTSGVFIYGCQAELGSYATSYIPTLGAAVTRSADEAEKDNISALIGTEFTIFYDGFETIGGQATRYLVLKGSGGTYANAVFIEGSSANTLALTVLNNASATVFSAISASLTNGQRIKFAVRCKANDFAFYVNGSLVAAQASGSVPTTADLYLGYYVDFADNYSLPTTAAIYTSGLSNATLATLTSL